MPDLSALRRTRSFTFALWLSLSLLVATIIAQPGFGDPSNWPEELASFAPLALVAMASTPAILSGPGSLDISLGPLMVFCNVFLVVTLLSHGVDSAWIDVPIILALGAAIGTINGLLVAVFRYQSIIATLCMFFILSGIDLKLGAAPHTLTHNWTTSLAAQIGPVPGSLILLAVPVAAWLLLSRTAYHRGLYAVGANGTTAFSAGVNVPATRVLAFALGGLFSAGGGIALTALVQSSEGSASAQFALIGLAAVALGGTSFAGGRGSLLGSVLGAAALYLIQTLLSALSVPPTWLQVVYGVMLLVGVILGARVAMRRPRMRIS